MKDKEQERLDASCVVAGVAVVIGSAIANVAIQGGIFLLLIAGILLVIAVGLAIPGIPFYFLIRAIDGSVPQGEAIAGAVFLSFVCWMLFACVGGDVFKFFGEKWRDVGRPFAVRCQERKNARSASS